MENAIEIKNLKKHYYIFDKDYKIIPWIFTKRGNNQVIKVIDDISITVKKGEVVGIIGANGAGKSTLMKIVAGITSPTEGKVEVNGLIGSLINLNAGFNPEFTGRENIYYKSLLLGMTKEMVDEIIDDITDFVEIGNYMDMPIKTYSSGMTARLGFALAVYSNPDVLIVDEVFAVGDINFREKSKEKTVELFKSGKSILFASHSEALIKEFCHRVIYINDGIIQFDGDVQEGLDKYSDIMKKYRKKRRNR